MGSYVFHLTLLFLVVVFLRVDFFFTVLYFLLGVYVLSRTWARRSLGNLRADRSYVDRAFTGDRVPVHVRIENRGWLPVPWLEVTESLPLEVRDVTMKTRVLSLGAHETYDFSYTLACRRRGLYEIGPLRLRTGDLIGAQGTVNATVASGRITVYPRVVSLERLGIPTRSPLAMLPARSPLFEDASRLMGVRDYQRGDSQRRIHWSATARADRLVVKKYQPAIARETVICLDMDEEDYGARRRHDAIEMAIVVAASVANYVVVNEGLPVGLCTEAIDPLVGERTQLTLPPRSEHTHLLMNLLETLAHVRATTGTSFPEMVHRESVRFSWGTTVVLVTGRESPELFDTLLLLRRGGFTATLVLIQPGLPSEGLRQQSDVLGVRVHRVWTDSDLEAAW